MTATFPSQLECSIDDGLRTQHASHRLRLAGPIPQSIAYPRDSADVIELVNWANRCNASIVPISSTGKRRRDGSVPMREHSVIADLSKMARLIHADSRDKIAIIEPGIDFASIDAMLRPHQLRAFRPLAPRAGKSVLASYLEREPILAANDHWDVSDPLAGTGVVFGNGRYAPTGSAALPGTLSEQLALGHRHMVAPGPTNLDLLRVMQGAQGSLGIMVWAAIYCERIPSLEQSFFASADELAPVIDLCRELLHRRLGAQLFIADRTQLALLLANDQPSFQRLRHTLPAWTLFISLNAHQYAPAEKMAWQLADLSACASRYGTVLCERLLEHSADALAVQLRTPSTQDLRDRPYGAHHELFFLQQLDRIGDFLPLLPQTLQGSALADAPIGVYLQPTMQGSNCHVEFVLPCAPGVTGAEHALRRAAERCADAGAFFSRPHGPWRELAYTRAADIAPLLRLSKSTLDPGNVMNPGRFPS